MEAVKVQYTVRADYVDTNKTNIQRVMTDLKAINPKDIWYSAYLLEDGKTFVHFVMRLDENAQKTLSELPSFQEFQRQLRESGPEAPPEAKNLAFVGTSKEIF